MKAILLVSFGTTFTETRIKNIEALAEKIGGSFSDYALYQAYTSEIVRSRLEKRDGIHRDSLEEAFRRMKKEGISQVFVQPTHVIAGNEFDKIVAAVTQRKGDFALLKVGKVLLFAESDYEGVATALWESALEDANNAQYENYALLLMGHGSPHQAGVSYEKLQKVCTGLGIKDCIIGTVEGEPDFEAACQRLHSREKARNRCYSRILLRPLMLVAGDHANNDMAGEEDSWKTALEAEGYQVDARCKGLGEYESIQTLYLEHLASLLSCND